MVSSVSQCYEQLRNHFSGNWVRIKYSFTCIFAWRSPGTWSPWLCMKLGTFDYMQFTCTDITGCLYEAVVSNVDYASWKHEEVLAKSSHTQELWQACFWGMVINYYIKLPWPWWLNFPFKCKILKESQLLMNTEVLLSFQKMLCSLTQKDSSKLSPLGYRNTETRAITCSVWWKHFSWLSPIKNMYLVFNLSMYVPFMVRRKEEKLQSITHPLLKQTTVMYRTDYPPEVPSCPGQLVQHHLHTHHPPLSFSSRRSIVNCPTTQHQHNSGTKHLALRWILLQRCRHHWVEARVKLGHHQNCWVEKWELCQHILDVQGQSDYLWKWLYTASEHGHERCWLLFYHCNGGVWNQHLWHHHSQRLRYKLDGSSWLYPVFKH